MGVFDDLGMTREDVADIAAKRHRHLVRLIEVASEAREHVRHAPSCPSVTLGVDEHCECGAVDFLVRLDRAIRNSN